MARSSLKSALGPNARLFVLRCRARTILVKGAFSNEYFDFYFTDLSSQKHYGWIYGSLRGGFSDLNYNLISYGYDTTPNEQIGAGYTGTPEPSTGIMFTMAALILGAAGVRKRNKAAAA